MNIIDFNNLTEEQNRKFAEISYAARLKYNNLIQDLSVNNYSNLSWIFSSIASRNKYYSDLYTRCCKIDFILSEVNNNIDKIIIDDYPLFKLMSKNFTRKNFGTEVTCSIGIAKRAWDYLRPLRQLIISSYKILLRYLGSRLYKKKTSKKIINKTINLVDVFVLNNDPWDDGGIVSNKYRDRYFPGMIDTLDEKEKCITYYLTNEVGFSNPMSYFQKVRGAIGNFLILDDFLCLKDYLAALTSAYQSTKLFNLKTIDYSGFNIKTLINNELLMHSFDEIGINGFLNYRFAFRLSKINVCVKNLIDWYENQPIDRGLILGFKKFHSTRVVGYQGYVISRDVHLYIYPNQSEVCSLVIPDVIYVIGEGLVENMYEFTNNIEVKVAPAFRYSKLWREEVFAPNVNKFTILIALPIDFNSSIVILDHVLKFFNAQLEQIRFIIKVHPTMRVSKILKKYKKLLTNNYEFKGGDFHDILETCDAVITNASTTALESVAKGKPVLIVSPNSGLAQSPIPNGISDKFWKKTSSSYTINNFINDYIDIDQERKNLLKMESRDIRLKYFAPISKAAVNSMFNIK